MLTQREIANQEKATFEEQQRARDGAHRDGEGQGHRRHAGAARGVGRSASRSSDNEAAGARGAGAGRGGLRASSPARPRPTKTEAIGLAEAKATEALGLARAAGFEAQKEALGGTATALVAVANAVADGHITVVPEVLVTGGGGGALDGLAATLMRTLGTGNGVGAARGARRSPVGAAGEVLDDARRAEAAARSEPAPERRTDL